MLSDINVIDIMEDFFRVNPLFQVLILLLFIYLFFFRGGSRKK